MATHTLEEEIARLLRIGWSGAQREPARLYPGDRRQIARRAFNAAHLELGDDPRMVAAALGLRVTRAPWLSGCGGEVTDGQRIVYRPNPDPRKEQLCAAHGLAHALLFRERWEHTETDALLLTSDLFPLKRE